GDAAHAGEEGVRGAQTGRLLAGDAPGLPHPVAQHLAAAEDALVAVAREVALDGGPEVRVAEPDLVAGGRAVEVGVGPPVDLHSSAPPDTGTSRTVFWSPGSKRTAVPAGMSRRRPVARARSNASARLVSANGKWLPTWIGRSPRFSTTSSTTSRPAFSSISPSRMARAPGSSPASAAGNGGGTGRKLPWSASARSPCGAEIGSCTVTSLVPSAKVPS